MKSELLYSGDNWVPEVKIVRTCRLGPWLDPKAFAGLRDAFPFGNLQDAVECIVKVFIARFGKKLLGLSSVHETRISS